MHSRLEGHDGLNQSRQKSKVGAYISLVVLSNSKTQEHGQVIYLFIAYVKHIHCKMAITRFRQLTKDIISI